MVAEVVSDAPDTTAASAFMHFIAWVAAQFAQHVKRSKRIANSTPHSHEQAQHSGTAHAASQLLSADFHLAALLLQPLLRHVQAIDTSSTATDGIDTIDSIIARPPTAQDIPVIDAALTRLITAQTTAETGRQSALDTGASDTTLTGLTAGQSGSAQGAKQRKGQKQKAQQAVGRPVPWGVAARGTALLVCHLCLLCLLAQGQFSWEGILSTTFVACALKTDRQTMK